MRKVADPAVAMSQAENKSVARRGRSCLQSRARYTMAIPRCPSSCSTANRSLRLDAAVTGVSNGGRWKLTASADRSNLRSIDGDRQRSGYRSPRADAIVVPTVFRHGPYRFFFFPPGMSSSPIDSRAPRAMRVPVPSDALVVDLTDGRQISVPLTWFPRLRYGSAEERAQLTLTGPGEGVHWPALDEDVLVEDLLAGRPSGESERSFRRWLQARGTD